MQFIFGVRVGRHKACPYRGHGGRFRGTTWVGDRWHRQHAGDAAPTWHGVRGALRGESPRTREGRRPDRTTAVVSDQWSEGTALALVGDANWLWVGRCQRCTRVHLHFGLHPEFCELSELDRIGTGLRSLSQDADGDLRALRVGGAKPTVPAAFCGRDDRPGARRKSRGALRGVSPRTREAACG